jgi:hypothetical protein
MLAKLLVAGIAIIVIVAALVLVDHAFVELTIQETVDLTAPPAETWLVLKATNTGFWKIKNIGISCSMVSAQDANGALLMKPPTAMGVLIARPGPDLARNESLRVHCFDNETIPQAKVHAAGFRVVALYELTYLALTRSRDFTVAAKRDGAGKLRVTDIHD